jgi:lysophospholipase L1-like esterase
MSHVVLLGDSIFDNAAYTRGGPDVIRQIREQLPAGWKAALRAVDGNITRDVKAQLVGVPADATHLVVSAGGNDALGHTGILQQPARSFAEVLASLAQIAEGFEREYRRMLEAVLERGLPTVVCTIYNGRFPDATMQTLTSTALTVFNDVITRQAFLAGMPLIDLRLICTEDADYANPIEPSSRGGDKIARAIARAVTEHDFTRRRTEVFLA